MFSTLTIVGVGLIGGSLGLAAKKHGVARRVIGVGRNEKGLARALQLGVVDEITTDVAAGVRESELVVVCTPVEWIAPYVREVAAHAPSGTLITDAGSTKEALVKQVEADLQRAASSAQFVGSHPMAGSEKNGADHGRADLFERRVVIVTPAESSQLESVERICVALQIGRADLRLLEGLGGPCGKNVAGRTRSGGGEHKSRAACDCSSPCGGNTDG
jgi:prephenate dehydrogenase